MNQTQTSLRPPKRPRRKGCLITGVVLGVGLFVMLIVAAAVTLLYIRGDGFRLPGEAEESAAVGPLVIILSPTRRDSRGYRRAAIRRTSSGQ